MNVLRATESGLCFGVRDALVAADAVAEPSAVTIHGQLVHNPAVLTQLTGRGFVIQNEFDRDATPTTASVMITAHGISDRHRRSLLAAGKTLIDTTCPLVRRAHEAARKLQRTGCHVLVIGKPGHVEVEGITGDLTSFDVVPDAASVRHYPFPVLGVVCQTTSASRDVAEVRAAIIRHNPHADIRFIDTVCQPTKDRQQALDDLLGRVEAVVVVGGRNSNNTRKLVERCVERGVPAFHVESPRELRAEWFAGMESVGLTAGTSTPDQTLDAVHAALARLDAAHATHATQFDPQPRAQSA